jgi:hypothetical protein
LAEYDSILVAFSPRLESALFIAKTWPSIIEEGATMSAPASAWLDAISANMSSVESLSTLSSLRTRPQCPDRLYWQTQTSVAMRMEPPKLDFIALTACWTMPFLSAAADPELFRLFGIPNTMMEEMPLSAIDWMCCDNLPSGMTAMPGIASILLGFSETKTGDTR